MNLNDLKTWLDSRLASVIDSRVQITTERNLLLNLVMGYSQELLYSNPDYQIKPDDEKYKTLELLIDRRIEERMPVQYLLGETVFCGLTLKISPAVLIPRPETELLVEHAIELCKSNMFNRVLDLGTGSGCIAIALKKQLPHLELTAVDLSHDALCIARENANLHNVSINFMQGSWFTPVEDKIFDLVISNPPYIHSDNRSELLPEVLHEPDIALFAQEDPLTLYYELINEFKKHLDTQGCFIFEIGAGQALDLQKISRDAGFKTEIFKDYAGIDRVIKGCL